MIAAAAVRMKATLVSADAAFGTAKGLRWLDPATGLDEVLALPE